LKRILLVAVVLAALGVLVAGFAIPAFAHGPEVGDVTTAGDEAWEAMHQACEDGNWEAMAQAAEEVHGEDFDSMPCHGDGSNDWGMGGHMGGGMMGWY